MDIEKSFDGIPRKVLEWALRNKDLPELMVRVTMSLYHRAKMKVNPLVHKVYLWIDLLYSFKLC